MPTRIAVNTLILIRNNKRVVCMPGDEVDLTDDELKAMNEESPDAIRKPVREANSAPAPSTGKGGKDAGAKDEF